MHAEQYVGISQYESDRLSQYDFRVSIVHALLEIADDAPLPLRRGWKHDIAPPRRLVERHFPTFIEPAPGRQHRHGIRDCVACNVPTGNRQGFKRHKSSFQFHSCAVALCVPVCFEVYHTVKDYKAALRH